MGTALALVCIAAFLYMLGLSVVFPVVPTFTYELGLSKSQAGVLIASYAAASFVIAPLWGKLSQTYGRKPILLLGLAGFSLGFLGFASASSFGALLLARCLGGLFAAAVMPAIFAYAADVTTPERRSTTMGLIGASIGMGVLVGVLLGGWLGDVSRRLPFFVTAAIGAVSTLCTFLWVPESLTPALREQARAHRAELEARGMTTARLASALLPLLAFAFLFQMARSALEGTVGFLVNERLHGGTGLTGAMLGASTLVAVALQGGGIRSLSRRFGDHALLLWGTAVATLGLLGAGLATHWSSLLAASTLLGAGAGLVEPTFRAELSRAGESIQGETQGLHSSVQSAARAVSFSAFPVLYSYLSAEWVFAIASVTGLLSLAVVWRSPSAARAVAASAPANPQVT